MINGWATLDDVQSANWQPALGDLGGVVSELDDISQCIQTILRTPLGSDFWRPTFGSDWHTYLDWPITAVTPQIIGAIVQSLTIWEPRIVFQWATVRPYLEVQPDGSDLLIEVSWTLALSAAIVAAQTQQIQTTLINVSTGGLLG